MESREGCVPNENNPESIRNKAERLEIAKKAAIRKAAQEVLEGVGATN